MSEPKMVVFPGGPSPDPMREIKVVVIVYERTREMEHHFEGQKIGPWGPWSEIRSHTVVNGAVKAERISSCMGDSILVTVAGTPEPEPEVFTMRPVGMPS